MGKIKKWYLDLSIKRAFILVTFLAIIASTFLSVVTMLINTQIRNSYYKSIKFEDSHLDYCTKDQEVSLIITEIESRDVIGNLLTTLIFVTPIFIFILSMVVTSYVFYNTKLKCPIDILQDSAKKIGNKELDFQIYYESKDEMGYLCKTFDAMRQEMLNRYKHEWRMDEERKRLNRAFAHDLRTPVTIIKGHLQVLEGNLQKGCIDGDKIQSTVKLSLSNVNRIQNYIDTMYSVQKLDDIVPIIKRVMVEEYINHLIENFELLVGSKQKKIFIQNQIELKQLYFDPEIVARILENIISNCTRYAEDKVCMQVLHIEGILIFDIKDDGKGFDNEGLEMAVEPFYRDKNNILSEHLGLGLYIAEVLCEKHHGQLTIANHENGGAHIRFSIKTHY